MQHGATAAAAAADHHDLHADTTSRERINKNTSAKNKDRGQLKMKFIARAAFLAENSFPLLRIYNSVPYATSTLTKAIFLNNNKMREVHTFSSA